MLIFRRGRGEKQVPTHIQHLCPPVANNFLLLIFSFNLTWSFYQ
uniref:Uncharacterized protein n=1 Tax=Anguilla anguilla TaxID=7936 RepID=A0A0E9T0A4_ANGAN